MRLPMTFLMTWFTESLNWLTHPGRLRQDQTRPARADPLALLIVKQGEQRSIFTAMKHSGKESEQRCGNQKLHHIVVKLQTLVCPSFSCGEKIIKRRKSWGTQFSVQTEHSSVPRYLNNKNSNFTDDDTRSSSPLGMSSHLILLTFWDKLYYNYSYKARFKRIYLA